MRRLLIAAIPLALGLSTAVARGSDGVIEINQEIALAGGVTGSLTDDPPGYPVVITKSGSYRLTGDLNNSSTTLSAISITASFVSLDLAGFTIHGPSVCQLGGFGVTCTNTGTAAAIDGASSIGSTVRNGTVTGAPGSGVALGTGATIAELKVIYAGVDGISVGNGARIERAAVILVGNDCIRAGHSYVADSLVMMARFAGVRGTNAAYLTSTRNVHAVLNDAASGMTPDFVNTVSMGPNVCDSGPC